MLREGYNPGMFFQRWIYLQQNTIDTYDSYAPGFTTHSSSYYDVDYKVLEQSSTADVKSNFADSPEGRKLYAFQFMISQNKVAHSRRVYNFLDLIGELGGVYELIFYLFLVMWLKKQA